MSGGGRGKGSGTGQPISFKCFQERSTLRGAYERHDVELTGRERPRRRHTGGRMDKVEREYTCSCGHTGWSAHVDLSRAARKTEEEATL